MKNLSRPIRYALLGGFFIALDQFLKHWARANQAFSWTTFHEMLGWKYFENTGIAFSLPFPPYLILLLTPFILLFLFVFFRGLSNPNFMTTLGVFWVVSGAISNFADRILFGFTTDYFLFFTSVINIADILITFGAFFIFLGLQQEKRAKP
ncbi:signal peptidase II [Candidatus Nomurabacteria bacterium]|nr:signal peptidase II [Candidatus Nomurabacteria bacterium]